MPGIIVVTTRGDAKRHFANTLQKETGGSVKLVVLQKIKKKSLLKKISALYRKAGLPGLVSEIYHFLSIKLSRSKRNSLKVFYARPELPNASSGYPAETLEANDINDDAVYERVKEINPDIIAIWGGYILKPRLLGAARFALNIHFGVAPYYRGVNGIQTAILNNDFGNVGITIHHVTPEVDAGEIVKVVRADPTQPPERFFKDLNSRALREYLETVKKLLKQGEVSSEPQDLSKGRNYLSKEWTYGKQSALAEKIIEWSKKYGSAN